MSQNAHINAFLSATNNSGGTSPQWTKLYREDAESSTNPRVYFEIEIGGKKAGKITMELFENVNPKTTANFQALYVSL